MSDPRMLAQANTVARPPVVALFAAAVILAGLVVAIALPARRANSATWDETMYLSLGQRALVGDGPASLSALGVAPLPVRLVWNRGVFEPLSVAGDDPALYRQRVEIARLHAILLFGVPLALVILVWLSFRHGVMAAATAAAVVALSPNVVAHTALATTDVAFTLTFITAIVAVVAYLQDPRWSWTAALAVALGVALATKYSAVGLFVIASIAFAINLRRIRVTRDVVVLAGGFVVAWALHGWEVQPLFSTDGFGAVMVTRVLGWTGMASTVVSGLGSISWPIVLQGIAAQMNLEQRGQEAFLLGQVSTHGWWYFFPVATAMKSTPVELLAFIACAWGMYWRGVRDVETQVVLIAIVVFGGLAMLGHRDLGVRYVLPIIVLAVATGIVWVADRLQRWEWSAVAAVAVALQAYSSLSMGSQQLAYFNVFAGGPAEGYTRLVDSNLDWGQDLLRLHTWLTVRGEDRVGLAYFGSAPPEAYGIRAVDWRPAGRFAADREARFVVVSATYLQGVFVCSDPFAALRALHPSDRIGYSLMAYDVSREDVRGALVQASADSCAPR